MYFDEYLMIWEKLLSIFILKACSYAAGNFTVLVQMQICRPPSLSPCSYFEMASSASQFRGLIISGCGADLSTS